MNLLEKTVSELLKKLGKGNHKPGSRSTAAFQDMVAQKIKDESRDLRILSKKAGFGDNV